MAAPCSVLYYSCAGHKTFQILKIAVYRVWKGCLPLHYFVIFHLLRGIRRGGGSFETLILLKRSDARAKQVGFCQGSVFFTKPNKGCFSPSVHAIHIYSLWTLLAFIFPFCINLTLYLKFSFVFPLHIFLFLSPFLFSLFLFSFPQMTWADIPLVGGQEAGGNFPTYTWGYSDFDLLGENRACWGGKGTAFNFKVPKKVSTGANFFSKPVWI